MDQSFFFESIHEVACNTFLENLESSGDPVSICNGFGSMFNYLENSWNFVSRRDTFGTLRGFVSLSVNFDYLIMFVSFVRWFFLDDFGCKRRFASG